MLGRADAGKYSGGNCERVCNLVLSMNWKFLKLLACLLASLCIERVPLFWRMHVGCSFVKTQFLLRDYEERKNARELLRNPNPYRAVSKKGGPQSRPQICQIL